MIFDILLSIILDQASTGELEPGGAAPSPVQSQDTPARVRMTSLQLLEESLHRSGGRCWMEC